MRNRGNSVTMVQYGAILVCLALLVACANMNVLQSQVQGGAQLASPTSPAFWLCFRSDHSQYCNFTWFHFYAMHFGHVTCSFSYSVRPTDVLSTGS